MSPKLVTTRFVIEIKELNSLIKQEVYDHPNQDSSLRQNHYANDLSLKAEKSGTFTYPGE